MQQPPYCIGTTTRLRKQLIISLLQVLKKKFKKNFRLLITV